jgi:hypothetical protein
MYPIRTVNEIIDAAVKNAKTKLDEELKGKSKYAKRMKNREKIKKR